VSQRPCRDPEGCTHRGRVSQREVSQRAEGCIRRGRCRRGPRAVFVEGECRRGRVSQREGVAEGEGRGLYLERN